MRTDDQRNGLLLRRVGVAALIAALVVTGCSSKRNGADTTAASSASTASPSVPPGGGTGGSGSAGGVASTLPDSIVESVENAYDYETVPPSTDVAPTLPTVVLAPLGTSPAERLARTPPTTGRIGSIDNDAAAAAPDTRIPTRADLPNPPAPPVPPTEPIITVPDLGLDAAAAEKIMAAVRWPGGLAPLEGASPDVAGNAVANTYAGDAVMRRSLRSGAGRLLQRGQESPVVASIVLVDRAGLGTNPLAVIRRSLRNGAGAGNDLVGGLPAIAIREQGALSLVVLSGNRVIGVAGTETQEQLVRDVVQALVQAA